MFEAVLLENIPKIIAKMYGRLFSVSAELDQGTSQTHRQFILGQQRITQDREPIVVRRKYKHV